MAGQGGGPQEGQAAQGETVLESNGPEVRGSKPVTVYFEKWQDKEEVLRKVKLLKVRVHQMSLYYVQDRRISGISPY